MRNEILIKDSKLYDLRDYKDEAELEKLVVKYHKKIFGKNSLYFDVKKLIGKRIGEKTIPDGYLIDFNTKKFYIIEVELLTHREYDHINKQIGKFNKALKDYNTRQKIAEILSDYVKDDKAREKFVRAKIGKKELFRFFLEILENFKKQKYSVVVIIDKRTKDIEDACDVLSPKPEILQFKTFVKRGTKNVYMHLFEPIEPTKSQKQEPARKQGAKKGTFKEECRISILKALTDKKGRAKIADIWDPIHKGIKHRLTQKDYEKGKSGLIKWKHHVHSTKARMVREGLLKKRSDGIWKITDKGEKYS